MSTASTYVPDPRIAARALPDERAAEILAEALARATGAAGASPLIVFDLDSTLLDNRPRQALILREYGAEVGHALLAGASPDHWHGWDVRVAMANAGLSPEDIERHFEPFRGYWFERFFTSHYCAVDRPIAGAPAYARAASATGARVLYVTGRHEEMRAGTIESFVEPGFPAPDGDGVQLIMKPTLDEHDDAYKERTYARLRELGAVVAAFDNEPTHINGYRAGFPDALCVHLATDHSLRDIPVDDAIPSIRDFSAFRPQK
jgi:hypothetical protein